MWFSGILIRYTRDVCVSENRYYPRDDSDVIRVTCRFVPRVRVCAEELYLIRIQPESKFWFRINSANIVQLKGHLYRLHCPTLILQWSCGL